MNNKVKTLGFFILDHVAKNEGFGDTSLQHLVEQGHIDKLPLLNRSRFEGAIETSQIRKIKTSQAEKTTWSPTTRFLYQMHTRGKYEQLELPQDKLIVTTNRKTIQRIIEHLRDAESFAVSLRTKMKRREYGRELLLSYANKQEQRYYFNRLNGNKLIGLSFNSYLVNDDCESLENRRKFTLFSIHALVVGSVCFVYEAEIDAIEKTQDDNSSVPSFSVVEVKTEYRELKVRVSFDIYAKIALLSNRLNVADVNENQELTRLLDEINKRNKEIPLPFLQGELGNVQKFIYGFPRNGNITTREFSSFPGILLDYNLSHLENFVMLLESTEFCSLSSQTMWDDWQDWELLKATNSIELCKVQRDLLAQVKIPFEPTTVNT